MKTINVLVTTSLDKVCLGMISSVSPSIKLQDISSLISAEQKGDINSKKQLDTLLAEADVIYGRRFPPDIISHARAPRLKWVQTMSTGVDKFLTSDIIKSPVIMTNARGIHATPVSEFALQMMLMFVKQAPLCFRLKQKKRWEPFMPTLLYSKTVGILGLGSIGRGVARLAKAFGSRVLGTDIKRLVRARYVDLVLPVAQLPQLLSESDFVVITLPLTTETRRLIGERELRHMKSTAYLINVARGEIVDEEALVQALGEQHIAGAGLDVFAVEPLPTESRLWEFPNVIFSPHVAGFFEENTIRITELFCENLRHYLDGKKLRNMVDKKKGF